jgi:hypothetical protein
MNIIKHRKFDVINKNIKKVYLHVGMHKTGSSSIQNTIFKNPSLFDSKFYYPKSWGPNHYNFLGSTIDNKDTQNMLDNLEKYTDFLKEEMNAVACEYLVISSEFIVLLEEASLIYLKDYLLMLFPNAEFEILMYVRNTKDWTSSMYQERLKTHGSSGEDIFDTLLKVISSLFKDRISKFVKIFGEDNVQVIQFEKACKNDFGLVGDFLHRIGVKGDILIGVEETRVNESLSNHGADIIDFINKTYPQYINAKLAPVREQHDVMPIYKFGSKKFQLTYNQNEQVEKASFEDRQWLNEKYAIDYTEQVVGIKDKDKFQYDDNYVKDFKNIIAQCSDVIKYLMYQFLVSNLEECLNQSDKVVLEDLINILRKKYKKVLSKNSVCEVINENLRSSMNIDIDDLRNNHKSLYKMDSNLTEVSSDISKFDYVNNEYKIESTGKDPYFFLPNFKCKAKSIALVVEIDYHTKSVLQVLYKTIFSLFYQKRLIICDIFKGKNVCVIPIKSNAWVRKLRIDPGDNTGSFTIKSVEIYQM